MIYQNNNRETTKELQRATALSELTGYPRKVADAIVPIIETNYKVLRGARVLAKVTGLGTTQTAYSLAPAPGLGKRYVITGVSFSNYQDVVSDNILLSVFALFGNQTVQIYARNKPSVTVSTTYDYLSFEKPLETDENTPVTIGASFTAGVCNSAAVLYGYIEDIVGA